MIFRLFYKNDVLIGFFSTFASMNSIKKEISEQFEDISFLPGEDDNLIGYAEMFGNDCILLYNNINFIRYNSPSECLDNIRFYSSNCRVMDGYDSYLIGH